MTSTPFYICEHYAPSLLKKAFIFSNRFWNVRGRWSMAWMCRYVSGIPSGIMKRTDVLRTAGKTDCNQEWQFPTSGFQTSWHRVCIKLFGSTSHTRSNAMSVSFIYNIMPAHDSTNMRKSLFFRYTYIYTLCDLGVSTYTVLFHFFFSFQSHSIINFFLFIMLKNRRA